MKTRRYVGLALATAILGGCLRTSPEQAEVSARPFGSCVVDERGAICTAGRCTLAVPPGSVRRPIAIEVAEIGVPSAVAGEVLGDAACQIGPPGLSFSTPARLTLEITTTAPGFRAEDAVLVFVDGAELAVAADTQVQPGERGVAASVDGAQVVALGFLAARVRLLASISASDVTEPDAIDILRTFASRPFGAAFHDGQRLYIGHGDRVLIYTMGTPQDPLTLPDLVVGAADLFAPGAGPSSRSIGAIVTSIWSDGDRLVVAAGNRVLIWNQVPTESGAPADLVLGQARFSLNSANRGRGLPGADTLAGVNQLASDGQRLLVADSSNNRVLVWDRFPTLVGEPASVVVGQPDFTSRAAAAGAIPFSQTRGVYFDGVRTLFTSTFGGNCAFGVLGVPARSNPADQLCIGTRRYAIRVGPLELSRPGALSGYGAGGLAVRDFTGRRVTVWRRFPDSGNEPPDFVVGRPGFDVGGAQVGGIRASTLAYENVFAGLYADAQRMVVPDGARVLIFEPPPRYGFAPATTVIGQGTFSALEPEADYGELDRDTLARPAGVSVGADGSIAIADTANDRVLLLRAGRTVVLGQPDPTAFGPNRFDGRPGPATLSGPEGVLLTDDALWVADTGNHRVLVFSPLPEQNGLAASGVLGQSGFDAGAPNRGLEDNDGDGDPDADAGGLFYPTGLVLGRDRLWVADTFNHRVLGYPVRVAPRGLPADSVIGQENFLGNDPNRGGGFLTPSAGGLAGPTGLAFTRDNTLLVADTENNRLLAFSDLNSMDPTPTAVFGQDDLRSHREPNFTRSNPGTEEPESRRRARAETVRRPSSIAVTAGGEVIVADTGNHRILRLPRLDFGPETEATVVLGQESLDRRELNAFGPGPRSLYGPFGLALLGGDLLVTDRENHRVLVFDANPPEATGAAAKQVLGQPDFLENGFNRSLGTRASISSPFGITRVGSVTWVSEPSRNRVIGFVDGEARVVLGQPGLTRVLANAGEAPSARTLAAPAGLASDGQRLVVADAGNHRVLVWDRPPINSFTPADRVFGQVDFSSVNPNRGAPPTRPNGVGLRFPQGVDLDGESLLVADTGNNRVLRFNIDAPPGGEASDVLCQPTVQDSRPNRGQSGARADGCFAPEAAVFIEEGIAVADTLNDRVLVFAPTGDQGRAASAVLGQPDFTNRASTGPQADSLSSPNALAWDGVNLVVGDAGHNRLLTFARPLAAQSSARQVIGQPSFETDAPNNAEPGLRSPAGIFAERASFIESRLWVADTGNGRVLQLGGLRR